MSLDHSSQSDDVKIAVIGLDCVFPQAENARTFWQNIIHEINATGDPLPSWNSEVHLTRRGDTSTNQGGYLKDLFRMEPAKFGIMPRALDGGEPDQFIGLDLARRALQDAGEAYLDPKFDHRDTGVIVGHSTYYHRGQINTAQHHVFVEQMREIVLALQPNLSDGQLEKLETLLRDQLPPFVTDIVPGLVPNVLTGRIANRLNLRGPNYLIDAACASSLLAVQAAVDELVRGNCKMMLVGGVNASLPAEVAIIFTHLGALSDNGRVRPFSDAADGTLLGEGAGMVVLKRLDDALADGDRIYSVIRGVGQSSDGRGLGLLSPSMDGEILAMRRAYDSSGIDPQSISLLECHGTGIPLGDRTEIGALTEMFGKRQGPEGEVAIGSVKSMIGHCIPAAGVAGLIKTSLALHHRLLPPTICDNVKETLKIKETRLFVNNSARPWIHGEAGPRRAGVNAFGFGGVNAHVILEEAPEAANHPLDMTPWSHELFVLAGADLNSLEAQIERLKIFAETENKAFLGEIARACWNAAQKASGDLRLSIVAADRGELIKKLEQARKKLGKGVKPFTTRNGICFRDSALEGKLAFMFAGEGSQYLGMFEELACQFEPVRRWLDFWKQSAQGTGELDRTDIFYPRHSELSDEKRARLGEDIFSMAVGSEAAFVGGQVMFDLLSALGLRCDAMVGHSSGESSALVSAQVVRADSPKQMLERFQEITAMSRDVYASGQVPTGALLAVGLLDRDKVSETLKGSGAVIAMENCPNQTIVFSPAGDAEEIQSKLSSQGAVVETLPFDRGYHTEGFKPMQEAFERFYSGTGVHEAEVPLYSCASAAPFPADAPGIIALAGRQWSQSVRFVETIKAMYADGVRAFIEVAPGGKLSSFAQQILADHAPDADLMVAPSNLEAKPDLEVLLHLLGQLYAHGQYALDPIFAGRDLAEFDLDMPEPAKLRGMAIDNSIPRIHATPELVTYLQELGLGGGTTTPAMIPEPAPATGIVPPPPQDPSQGLTSNFGLLKQAQWLDPDTIGGEVSVSIAEAGFLQDHVLSGEVSRDPTVFGMSCVPFMVSLEIMAEAGAMLLGRRDLGLVEDMTGEGWVWADKDVTDIYVVAKRISETQVAAEIWSGGARAVTAKLSFGPASPIDHSLPPVQPGYGYSWTEPYEMYRENIFHGPLFQTIDTVTAWGPDGIEATLSHLDLHGFVKAGEDPDFIINPALFDAFTQASAFWMAEERGQYFASFPRIIRRIELYNPPAVATAGLWLRAARVEPPKPGGDGTWSVDCYQGERVLVRMRGAENAYSDLPMEYYPYSLAPINGWLGQPTQVEAESGTLLWFLPAMEPDFWRKVGGVFHRVLAFSSLGPAERSQWHSLAHDLDAREAWLMPRVAMKEAVRWWISEFIGQRLYSADIGLLELSSGLWRAVTPYEGVLLDMQVSASPEGLYVGLRPQFAEAPQELPTAFNQSEMEQPW